MSDNYSKKLLLSLMSFGIFMGIFLGSVVNFSDMSVNIEDLFSGLEKENLEAENCNANCNSNVSAHNVDWITQKVNGSLYSFNKPNISGRAKRLGLDPFYVDTNLKGLRDKQFQTEKPENTTRVLVLGTSTTFGYGVERNRTFVERTERKLNDELDKNIQILNAGSPGYGMKDYYQYLKSRGVKYQPDLVVVASNSIIWRSRKDAVEVNKLAGRELREVNRNLSEAQRRKKFKEFVSEELQNRLSKGIENTGMKYIHDINNLTSKRDTGILYYSINGLPYDGQKSYIESWAEKAGEEVYYAPDDYLYHSEKYDNSNLDTHPNAEGHRIIAEGLQEALLSELSTASY